MLSSMQFMNFMQIFHSRAVIFYFVLAIFSVNSIPAFCADEVFEAWQLKLQTTAIVQHKPHFDAPYTGPSSLLTNRENSRTVTATLYAGVRPWTGGEIYVNPEMALGVPFSELKGLGGFNNGEIARSSGANPTFYRARAFLRQTWGFGGGTEAVASDLNQLGGSVEANRAVLTLGNVSALDIFDHNKYTREPRRAFLNWALITYGAWDFPADARGYTWGAALEYVTPEWAVRAGRFEQPKESNGLPLDSRILSTYGDVIEAEHSYRLGGQSGRVRVLAFRNQAVMGSFNDAVGRSAVTGGVPDLTQVRTAHAKIGAGVNLEHELTRDVGFFARISGHDGRTETYAFTEIDRSIAAGTVIKGASWQRGGDEVGIAVVANGLSPSHRDYLARGGQGFFLGDGRLNYRSEQIFETYYSVKAARNLWFTLDYQYIRNPGYNADRGPANFFGLRVHAEL